VGGDGAGDGIGAFGGDVDVEVEEFVNPALVGARLVGALVVEGEPVLGLVAGGDSEGDRCGGHW
jgi:hypothetical protein